MKRKAKLTHNKRILPILKRLKKEYPDAKCSLNYSNPLELLIATILSAQCTDERVNLVTKNLFKKYKPPEDYVRAPEEEFQNDIRTTGFFRNKTRSIQRTCKRILEEFGG